MTISSPTNYVTLNAMSSRQTIVGDSSPLNALAIVGQLEVLPRLFQRVIVPQAVWEEVTRKVRVCLARTKSAG